MVQKETRLIQGLGEADKAAAAEGDLTRAQKAVDETKAAVVEGTCFVAGTKVLTPAGEREIETLTVGELVLACDPEQGVVESRAILQTFVRQAPVVLDIQVGEEVITCTPEHPFWVPERGWVDAGELQVGVALLTQHGKVVQVDAIERHEGEFTVYNFEVEELHTYFVSSLGILVHNTCSSNLGDNFRNPSTFATDIQKTPEALWNSSPQEIQEYFQRNGYTATIEASTKKGTSGLAQQIRIQGHPEITNIQVHPGGGRHEGPYIKISTSTQGKIKIVDPATYKPLPGDKAKIIYLGEL